jgi:hypothetical protein
VSTVKKPATHGEGPRLVLASAGAQSATNAIEVSAARASGLGRTKGEAQRVIAKLALPLDS